MGVSYENNYSDGLMRYFPGIKLNSKHFCCLDNFAKTPFFLDFERFLDAPPNARIFAMTAIFNMLLNGLG